MFGCSCSCKILGLELGLFFSLFRSGWFDLFSWKLKLKENLFFARFYLSYLFLFSVKTGQGFLTHMFFVRKIPRPWLRETGKQLFYWSFCFCKSSFWENFYKKKSQIFLPRTYKKILSSGGNYLDLKFLQKILKLVLIALMHLVGKMEMWIFLDK